MQEDYGQKKYKSKDKRKDRGSRIIIIIPVIFLLIILLFNFIGYHSTQQHLTEYGVLRDKFVSQGLIIRDEKVKTAPIKGQLEKKWEAGQRISASNQIATIDNGEEKARIYNYRPGIIRYSTDGLEETLSFSNLDELTYDKFKQVEGSQNRVSSGEEVNAGRPVARIIDNDKFYLAVLLSQDRLIDYETGTEVKLDIHQSEEFQGVITKIITDNPKNIILIEVKKFISELTELRKVDVEVLKAEHQGIVVPKSVLINQDGQTKVQVNGYISDYYQAVEVLGRVDEQAVIRGVGPGLRLIKHN